MNSLQDPSPSPRLRMTLGLAIAVVALLLRVDGITPPFDDLYHSKRIEFSAANWPRVLDFDPDRNAFTPWPPLYDVTAAALSHVMDVRWIAPLFFAAFAGVVAASFGWVAGVVIACSPYLLSISAYGHLDHHFLEAAFVVAMIVCLTRGRYVLLGFVMAAALMVQPAMIVACGVVFLASVATTPRDTRGAPLAFGVAASVVLLYRLTRADGYPESPWFLGYPHVALLAAAAVALRGYWPVSIALVAASPAALAGLNFFAGDPWLDSIVEFQPMFLDPSRFGTDLANLTGGAIAAFLAWRKHRTLSIFAIVYLLLSLTSRRFLVVGIPLFAICGSLHLKLLTVLPPVIYLLTTGVSHTSYDHVYKLAHDIRSLPAGRVLAPWSYGHAIDVAGKHPVVIDNFGSMPNPVAFANANDALLTTHASSLLAYCRARGIRYVVFSNPAGGLPAAAAAIGADPEQYRGTKLAQRTVWWRAYRNREVIPGMRLVRGGAIGVWKIDE